MKWIAYHLIALVALTTAATGQDKAERRPGGAGAAFTSRTSGPVESLDGPDRFGIRRCLWLDTCSFPAPSHVSTSRYQLLGWPACSWSSSPRCWRLPSLGGLDPERTRASWRVAFESVRLRMKNPARPVPNSRGAGRSVSKRPGTTCNVPRTAVIATVANRDLTGRSTGRAFSQCRRYLLRA